MFRRTNYNNNFMKNLSVDTLNLYELKINETSYARYHNIYDMIVIFLLLSK